MAVAKSLISMFMRLIDWLIEFEIILGLPLSPPLALIRCWNLGSLDVLSTVKIISYRKSQKLTVLWRFFVSDHSINQSTIHMNVNDWCRAKERSIDWLISLWIKNFFFTISKIQSSASKSNNQSMIVKPEMRHQSINQSSIGLPDIGCPFRHAWGAWIDWLIDRKRKLSKLREFWLFWSETIFTAIRTSRATFWHQTFQNRLGRGEVKLEIIDCLFDWSIDWLIDFEIFSVCGNSSIWSFHFVAHIHIAVLHHTVGRNVRTSTGGHRRIRQHLRLRLCRSELPERNEQATVSGVCCQL